MRGRRPVGSAQAGGRGAGEAGSPAGSAPRARPAAAAPRGPRGAPAGSPGHTVPPALPAAGLEGLRRLPLASSVHSRPQLSLAYIYPYNAMEALRSRNRSREQ